MAVTKLWKVSVRLGQVLDYTTNPEKTANPEYSAEDYQALKDVLAYAKDEEKTEHEFFCDGINCNVAMARDQFITVKEQFGKTDGIQAYHGYLSFKENEVTPEQAQQIGMEFARKMWGKRFQVVVTTHLNTKHLHCHFVINSVSFADGKRLKDKEKSWYYFRHIADEICLEHKLSIVEKPELHRSPAYLTMKDEAGMPTRYNNAKKAIDEAIAMSRNLRQFQYELSVMGYPDMGAFYKNEDQTLYVKRDIGDSVALCQCVAQELGHAELSMNSEVYSRRDMGFQAVCIGYMLCKKYGVDTQNFAIDRIPDELKNKEPKDIKAELGKTQKAFKEITARVSDELYRQRAERSKEQER